ncbi:MAG TPA: ABC transporter permease, partial [Vicinamibacterales bacterium]
MGDLRYAVRSLRATPAFTVVAVLTLALGIGANTAVFTLLNTLVLRTLPVRHPEQLVEMLFKYPKDPRLNSYTWKEYQRIRDGNHVFSDVFAWSPTGAARPVRIAHSDFGADTVEAALVSANFWDALGVRPAIGRAFRPDERQAALLSWAYWQSHFNGDRSAVGQSLTVDDTPATIVGVLPRGFFGLQIGLHPAIWMPVPADGEPPVQIVARLKPDVTLAQAQAEVRLIDRARLEEREARSHDVQWRQATITLEPAGAGLST